jgi:predicted CXXCH cytochrome family protein
MSQNFSLTKPRVGLKWATVLATGIFCVPSVSAVAQTSSTGSVPSYLSSQVCAECHEETVSAWRRSHHARAWGKPEDEAVLGNFNAVPFEKDGVVTRFAKQDGVFLITIENQDGIATNFKVVGTAGVTPLQQYLVEIAPGRLQALDVAWDDIDQRWYHLYPDLNLPPSDGLHWTGPYKNWNGRCAACHATGFVKNYDPRTRTYASMQAETGVGCEACHGPGEAHVAWAKDPSKFETANWFDIDALGLAHSFPRSKPEAEIQQCAGCHSRREPFGDGNPLPGTAFHDAYRLALMREGLYHADGQIQDEVYVYGSFLQSRMYARGVRCTNCHDPHSGQLRAEGNAVCTQCHSPAGNPDFSSLSLKDYDTPRHHFHDPGSAGAQCKSCHMIERVFMGIDGRRDHSFRIPRPDLSVMLGTPNACSDCHADRNATWAASEIASRYLDSPRREPHFSAAFTAAREEDAGQRAVTPLVTVASDQTLSGFVRASALQVLMRYASPEVAEQTKTLLQDEDALVRMAAVPLQWPTSPTLRMQRIAPLLKDPMKVVRIEAVRGLLDLLAGGHAPPSAESAQSAFLEYRQSLAAKADFPEAQMAIAGTALTFRRFAEAESAFSEAVQMDPQLIDAWGMMARLRAAQGDGDGAIEVLRIGLTFNPDSAPLVQLLKDFEATRGVE